MGLIFFIAYRILELLELVILVRCIMSFFPYNEFYGLLSKITEPFLSPLRRLLSKSSIGNGMFDFTPILAILIIGVVERCLSYLARLF